MTDFEFQVDGFMLYCTSRNLSNKTLTSYEQALKLFGLYLQDEFSISEPDKITTNHIRHYIKYLKERGKYTIIPVLRFFALSRNEKIYNIGIFSSGTLNSFHR